MNRRRLCMAMALGLTLLLAWIAWSQVRQVEDQGQDNASRANTTQPVESLGRQDFGFPDQWYVAGAVGQTYTETLSGTGLRSGEMNVLLGQSPPDGPYVTWYAVGRAYAGWDTSILPEGAEVLSATLILGLSAGGGREEPLEFAVYRGAWSLPIGLDDWVSPGSQVVGRWQLPASRITERETVHTSQDLTLYAPEPAHTVRVPLDPAVVQVGGITRLELRHAGEGFPPTTSGVVSLWRSQVTLEVKYRP